MPTSLCGEEEEEEEEGLCLRAAPFTVVAAMSRARSWAERRK